jgi:putative MATE family efflux protein
MTAPPQHPLLARPILPTLARMAAPNTLAMMSSTLVSIAETTYVGRLGVPSLAGLTLVFPLIMMMQMMSGGAMGGGVSSAVSRSLGARDPARTEALPLCAVVIGLVGGLFFSTLLLIFGPTLFAVMGGKGAVLSEAIAYSRVAALGVLMMWVSNTMGAVMRGAGRMGPPAAIGLCGGVCQIVVGGLFSLGLFGLPKLGITGVALGLFSSITLSLLLGFIFLRRRSAQVRLTFRIGHLRRPLFADILKVGALAVLSPLQSTTTVMVLTALVARFGVEAVAGYGIGARLEFLLIPLAFSVGVASLPMVGVAIGAGQIDRAKRVAWTSAAVAAAALGLVALIFAIWPHLWAKLFTHAPGAVDATSQYLRFAAVGFPFLGAGLSLYFSAQGAGRIGGPILAQSSRLAVVLVGGGILAAIHAPIAALFALISLSMIALGLGAMLAVKLTPWGPRAA